MHDKKTGSWESSNTCFPFPRIWNRYSQKWEQKLTHSFAEENSSDKRGEKIAFSSNHDHSKREIYVINSDGTGLLRLTNNILYDDMGEISADGSKIVFQQEIGPICIINSDGTGFLQLRSDPDDRWPSISGDGYVVVFSVMSRKYNHIIG